MEKQAGPHRYPHPQPVSRAPHTALDQHLEVLLPGPSWPAPHLPTERPRGQRQRVGLCGSHLTPSITACGHGSIVRVCAHALLSPCAAPALGVPRVSTRKGCPKVTDVRYLDRVNRPLGFLSPAC